MPKNEIADTTPLPPMGDEGPEDNGDLVEVPTQHDELGMPTKKEKVQRRIAWQYDAAQWRSLR